MKLHYQQLGEGQPLLIIHGLFGSLDNWRSMARYFSKFFKVISLDLRNHGQSPHSDEQSFHSMAEDVESLCQSLDIDNAHVLGHSLGGKVAMQFAAMYPQRVDKLVIVDISPRQYFSEHTPMMDAMMALDMSQYASRTDIDTALADSITDKTVRQFLLMNLHSDESGFKWRINLPALKNNYQQLMAPVCEKVILDMPSLFVYGEISEYVSSDDRELIEQHFMQAEFISIAKAGHWVHAEKPQQFKQVVEDFLRHD
ncbi:alpha/beta fold hydrolase [Methylophaga sp.]|uniref:alpha/beta fold hydrolase n=1 Tax=Methylophaga sp. TaxID=2024840 RepID=UPI003F69964B